MTNAVDTIQCKLPQVKIFSDQQRQLITAAAQQLSTCILSCSTEDTCSSSSSSSSSTSGSRLPCQVCHADANEHNMLVNKDRTQVTGIIDFGDMCYCWRVCEVAIAMTYIMLLEYEHQPVQAASHVLAGYQTVCPLLEAELAALPALIVGRIALSLTNGAYAAQNNPSNAEYVLITQRPGWSLLTELMQPDNEQLAVLVRQITAKAGCGV
eukprot:jgi/Chrzof1/1689/Cz10g17110.t1